MGRKQGGKFGWISFLCFGDSALVVDIIVALIKTFGLTDLVSDTLEFHIALTCVMPPRDSQGSTRCE
jgi:hypothetical protein